VSDQPTGRAVRLNPDVTARAVWLSVRRGEKWPLNFARKLFYLFIIIYCNWVFTQFLLHAVNLRHGTDGFTSPPKEVVLLIFITVKNPSTSVGIEPANLGSSGEHANH
jgi:hypothetical protein